jgi:SPX domain protein involved in polyphosphate accumulation
VLYSKSVAISYLYAFMVYRYTIEYVCHAMETIQKLCDSPKTTNCVTIQQTALHWVDESNLVELEDSPRPKSKRQLNVLRFAKQGLSESRSRPADECKKDSCVYFLIRHDGGCKPGPVWCAPSELYDDHESTYV